MLIFLQNSHAQTMPRQPILKSENPRPFCAGRKNRGSFNEENLRLVSPTSISVHVPLSSDTTSLDLA